MNNPNNQGNRPGGRKPNTPPPMKGMGFGLYFILLLIIVGSIGTFMSFPEEGEVLAYSDVIAHFENEEVSAFVIEGNVLSMQLRDEDKTVLTYELPSVDIFYYDLGETITEQRKSGIIEMQDF